MSGLLPELRRIHGELLSAIDALEALTMQEVPDRGQLASVRWKLSQLSRQRLLFLEEAIYPHLTARLNSSDRQKIEELRTTNATLRSSSNHHIADWTIDNVIADWSGYRQASFAMRNTMRQRVALERNILYPLLERAG